ncbi:hypothetical protein [Niallia taxi]|uniref:hypothetical protein n=1 Tax=Niallia taxi TaxID=2499688 RepID=UPI0015F363F5|nr:hypothetical protein [Niallia taxi]
MPHCTFCNVERDENDFYMHSSHKVNGREQKGYTCKSCSDLHYGDTWYPIEGYNEKCDISKRGTVRELRNGRYYNITYVQNAGKQYVYLSKGDKDMRKNVGSLMKKYIYKNQI